MTRVRHTTPKKVTRNAAHRASLIVDDMLGGARAAIAEALAPGREVMELQDDGSPQVDADGLPIYTFLGGADLTTARWLIDRALPGKQFTLAFDFKGQLGTIQDVVAGAETVAMAVMKGEIAVEEGQKAMDFLLTYCNLRAFTELDELRTLLAKMEEAALNSANGTARHLPDGTTPMWGRLASMQAANSKLRPAE